MGSEKQIWLGGSCRRGCLIKWKAISESHTLFHASWPFICNKAGLSKPLHGNGKSLNQENMKFLIHTDTVLCIYMRVFSLFVLILFLHVFPLKTTNYILEVWRHQTPAEVALEFAKHAALDFSKLRWVHRSPFEHFSSQKKEVTVSIHVFQRKEKQS